MAFVRQILQPFHLKNINKRGIYVMSFQRAEQIIENLKDKNPYYEKYAEKIARLQQTAPDEFVERVEKITESKNTKSGPQRSYSELMSPKQNISETQDKDNYKKLENVMKLELIQDKSAEEIKRIWYEYHQKKDVIAAVIPTEQYETMKARAKEFPSFLFPLPRSEGYEFILLQFNANSVHFTPLLCYQVHKENAPECLNIVHYSELRDKGIVLMRGEYDKQVLNGKEAQCLANELQMYYCKNDQGKLGLLQKFTNQPQAFKHMDLINELESIKLE